MLDREQLSASTPRDRALRDARQLVIDALGDMPARVYLIGSCARGDWRRDSDIDVAIECNGPVPDAVLQEIRRRFEESDNPFFVDVFDMSRVDEHHREEMRRDGVLWTWPIAG